MVHLVSFTNISDEFWHLTYFSRSDRSARLVCLSIQFLLAYIHDWHQTITTYLPCPVLVPHTIILALQPLTLACWPWLWLCLLPQNYLNQTSHQYQNGTFAAFCQYLGWVWRTVNGKRPSEWVLKYTNWLLLFLILVRGKRPV